MTSSASNTSSTVTGEPVPGFPIKFTWRTDNWLRIFDRQAELIKSDIARARADGRLAVYLSCPISSRGGGWSGTNVDIARHTERHFLQQWGEGFWVLNPVQYQLESKAGTGLIVSHATDLGINLEELLASGLPGGGDYLRMWTRVLVEDGIDNLGRNFAAFYFLGPSQVQSFFLGNGSTSLTAGIQSYFARKFESDATFRETFSAHNPSAMNIPAGILSYVAERGKDAQVFAGNAAANKAPPAPNERAAWQRQRDEFLRFYALRASANFSLGCHDEWLLLRAINAGRRKSSARPSMLDGDVGDQLAAFFDGTQVSPADTEATISRGYAN